MNYSTYLSSDVQAIGDVEKTMSEMFTSMASRQFVKSYLVWSKLKLFLWARTCLFFNGFYPMCCHSHERRLVWICPCISCKWNFSNWFLWGSKLVFYTKYKSAITAISASSSTICSSNTSSTRLRIVEQPGMSDSFSSSRRRRNIFLSLGVSITLRA